MVIGWLGCSYQLFYAIGLVADLFILDFSWGDSWPPQCSFSSSKLSKKNQTIYTPPNLNAAGKNLNFIRWNPPFRRWNFRKKIQGKAQRVRSTSGGCSKNYIHSQVFFGLRPSVLEDICHFPLWPHTSVGSWVVEKKGRRGLESNLSQLQLHGCRFFVVFFGWQIYIQLWGGRRKNRWVKDFGTNSFLDFCGLNFPLRRNRFLPTSNVLNKLEQTELINVSLPSRVWIQLYLRILSLHGTFWKLGKCFGTCRFFYLRDWTFWRKNQPCFEALFFDLAQKWIEQVTFRRVLRFSKTQRGSRPRPNVSEGSIYWNRSKRSPRNRSNSMTRRGFRDQKLTDPGGPPRGLCMFVVNMDVSENSGTPKSSILIGFSIINHPFWGATIFGNTYI